MSKEETKPLKNLSIKFLSCRFVVLLSVTSNLSEEFVEVFFSNHIVQ